MRYGDGDWAMHDDGGWWMALGWLIVLVILAAIAVAVIVAVLRSQQGVHPISGGAGRARVADPEQILAERLARGEIEPEEYRARLRVLREAQGP